MDLTSLATQVLTGLAYGMLLFMISSGLSVIFGLMNVVNLAHGAFYVMGVYIAFSLTNMQLGFWVALVLGTLAVAALGVLIERFLLTRTYGNDLNEVLLTFGIAFILADVVRLIWGSQPRTLAEPAILTFRVAFAGVEFPAYRLFVVAVGCLVAALLWYFETKTRIGAIVRAGVDDREMISALGINVRQVFSGVFAFGAGLAALGGILGGPIRGMYPSQGFDVLVVALIVVVLGGLGTWKGAFVGALLVGMVQTLGLVYFPSLSLVIVFVLMAVVLLVKPSGLFGRSVPT